MVNERYIAHLAILDEAVRRPRSQSKWKPKQRHVRLLGRVCQPNADARFRGNVDGVQMNVDSNPKPGHALGAPQHCRTDLRIVAHQHDQFRCPCDGGVEPFPRCQGAVFEYHDDILR